jgi:hypothetical protein
MKDRSRSVHDETAEATARLVRNVALLVSATMFLSCGSSPPDDIIQKSGQPALVFIKENSQQNNHSIAMASNADEYYPGSDLYLLSPISPQGELTNLTAQYTQRGQSNPNNFGAAADPEVSYDGKKILFSMKANRSARWHIYEMNIDGSDLVEMTDITNGDDMDPTYLPNGQILFTSTRSGIVDEYERRSSPLLHVADRGPDGRLINIRQISFNQSHDTNPIVHSSGKVIFSRWEHLGSPNKFPLFVINPDGSRLFVMYGSHTPTQSGSRVFLEPRELSDGGLVCSVEERTSPFEGGAIAIIDISKSEDNLTFITPASAPFDNTGKPTSALYKTPYPIIDKTAPADRQEKIIFAMSPIPVQGGTSGNTVDYGLYVMDKDGSNVRLIYNDPAYNEYDPVVVAPRDPPLIYPSDPNVVAGLQNGATTGMFFDGNVYDRSTTDGQLRPSATFVNADGTVGQARYLRVLEAVPLPRDGNKRGGPIGNTNFEKQRVVGYAPIQTDGSFSIEVPANTSLHVQTLDENGMMLVNQLTWIQVMPGEKRLCTGCHDSHDRDKVINDFVVTPAQQIFNKALGSTYMAGFNNASMVTAHPSARTDTVDFFDRARVNRTNTVQAIFDSRCVSCHSSASPAGGLDLGMVSSDVGPAPQNSDGTTTVYRTLIANGYLTQSNQSTSFITQDGARRSPLMWVMYNRQLNDPSNKDFRPLTYDHTAIWAKDQYGRLDPFMPQNRDLLTMIEWLDMGDQYSNTTTQ